jgi:hypothetical protein
MWKRLPSALKTLRTSPPSRVRVVEPQRHFAERRFDVVEPQVDVLLRHVAIARLVVVHAAAEPRERELSKFADWQILHATAVAAHVEEVEIVDVDVVPAVVALAGPKLGVGHALDHIARLHECMAQRDVVALVLMFSES